jgi:hypothetical protein
MVPTTPTLIIVELVGDVRLELGMFGSLASIKELYTKAPKIITIFIQKDYGANKTFQSLDSMGRT